MTQPWELLAARVAEPPPEAVFDWAPTHAEQEMLDRLGYEKSQFAPTRWVWWDEKTVTNSMVVITRDPRRTWTASTRSMNSPQFESLLALLSWLEIEGVRYG